MRSALWATPFSPTGVILAEAGALVVTPGFLCSLYGGMCSPMQCVLASHARMSKPGVLCPAPTYASRHGLRLELELMDAAGLSGQRAPGPPARLCLLRAKIADTCHCT